VICVSAEVLKRYEPRGAAKQVFAERGDEVLLVGPAGTGKTRADLEKLHAMALLNGQCPKRCALEHEHYTRAFRGLVVRQTLVSLSATAMVTYKEHVAKEAIEAGIVEFYGGSREEPAQYRYTNGSKIMLAGMDNPTKIMSGEFDVILVVEATELTITSWEKLKTRLRNGRLSFQQLLADCNPEQPTHWLKLRCDEGKTKMLYAAHTDNPRLFSLADDGTYVPTTEGAAYLKILDGLTGVRKLRLQGGIWAAAEGVIFEHWDPNVHLSDRKRLPYDWRRIWCIDFGYVNPFVWQQWAIDGDGRAWLELEVYVSQMLVEDVWREKIMPLLYKVGKNGEPTDELKYPRPEWVITDHDAEDRATFERHSGYRTIPALKDVSPGIQAMQARMKLRGDGTPGMYVLRTALQERDPNLAMKALPMGFVEEIPGYVWKAKPLVSAASTQDKPTPDEPLKANDHAMDAGRYLFAQLDMRMSPRVRRL
jgi:hypothetical protein